jgi:hypothetical protein
VAAPTESSRRGRNLASNESRADDGKTLTRDELLLKRLGVFKGAHDVQSSCARLGCSSAEREPPRPHAGRRYECAAFQFPAIISDHESLLHLCVDHSRTKEP